MTVQGAVGRYLFDEEPLLGLLEAAAVVAEELVVLVQHLGGADSGGWTGSGAGELIKQLNMKRMSFIRSKAPI